jgi:hypothetical protein
MRRCSVGWFHFFRHARISRIQESGLRKDRISEVVDFSSGQVYSPAVAVP